MLSNAVARLSMSRFVQQIFAMLSLEVVEKPNKYTSFWPHFFQEGRPQLIYSRLIARITMRRLAKFG